MFFAASKLLGFVVFHPVNLLVLAALFGVLLSWTRWARAGHFCAACAVLVLVVVAFSPVSALLLRPLEDRFPRVPDGAPAPVGIIVLGGALDEDLGIARGTPTLTAAASRLTSGVELARKYPDARLVFTGGSASLHGGHADEASGVGALWTALGVPPDRMILERKSRNTYENAVFTQALVQPKPGERWLLVTSAAHMPRAVGIFRKVGWPVVADPVDYLTFGDGRDLKPTAEALESLTRLDVALHEWVGLVAYRLTGKTDSLFPAP